MITQADADAAWKMVQEWRVFLMQVECRVNQLNAIIENERALLKEMENAALILQAFALKEQND